MFLRFLLDKKVWAGLGVVLFLSACTRVGYLNSPNIQTGLASWYGPKYHGRLTSSREKYNMYDLTAAHRTLPFGTLVMVTNSKNGKSVLVRINDRGPFIEGRIIDLSYAAARVIDMVGPGVVPVRLEIITDNSPSDRAPRCSVEAGTFVDKKKAFELRNYLNRKYSGAYVTSFKTANETYHIVRLKARSIKSANKLCEKLRKEGFEPVILARK